MRTSYNILFAVFVIGAIQAGNSSCCAAVLAAPPTLDELIAHIRTTEKLLFESESMLLHFARTKSETITSSQGVGGLLLADYIIAYRKGKWRFERRFTHPRRSKGLVIPGQSKIDVLRDGLVMEWKQEDGWAVLNRSELGRNSYQNLDYFRILSMNAPKYIARAIKAEGRMDEIRKLYAIYVDLPFLPDFLEENKANYRVLNQPEIVNGESCWVVEWSEMDRIWIDPQHSFAVARRSVHWAPNKPMRFEFINKDFRQVKPGLWLPFSQTESTYFSPIHEKAELAGKVKFRAEYEILEIKFDELSDDYFDVHLPEGTKVFDVVRNFQYVVESGTNDPMELPIVKGIEELRRPSRFWLALNVIVIILLGIVLLLRMWAKSKGG